MPEPEAVLLYITVPNRVEGVRIGKKLVAARLAACANVYDGATSIFHWDGQVQEETEALLIAKLPANGVSAATAMVVDTHPYDCPCVVALPISDGHPPFLQWIGDEADGSAK